MNILLSHDTFCGMDSSGWGLGSLAGCSDNGRGYWTHWLRQSGKVFDPPARSLTVYTEPLSGMCGPGERLAKCWTVRISNYCAGEIFRTRSNRPWGLSCLLYNGYRFSFLRVKRTGRDVDHPHPYSAEVKEWVELYLYSPSGASLPVLRWTSPLRLLSGMSYELSHICQRHSHWSDFLSLKMWQHSAIICTTQPEMCICNPGNAKPALC